MKRETLIWTMLLAFGAVFLLLRAVATERGVGRQYVVAREIAGLFDETAGKIVEVDPKTITVDDSRYHRMQRATQYVEALHGDTSAVFSLSRTIGIWLAALLTLCIFSYMYRDNVCYKLAEALIVGVSAGYAMVVAFWDVLIAKFLVRLTPNVARYAFVPDTPTGNDTEWLYLVPLILGVLVFARWLPKGKWLARWPLAFVVGTTAGLKLISFLDADFISQIRSTILPLVVFATDQGGARVFDWKQSLENIVLVAGVLTSLTYFYFSVEHTGVVGRISRLGVWVLMITFGASFALTVMSRITLLTMRLEFLFQDWLGIVGG